MQTYKIITINFYKIAWSKWVSYKHLDTIYESNFWDSLGDYL